MDISHLKGMETILSLRPLNHIVIIGSAGATSESLSLSLAAASLACAAGDTLAAFLGATSFSLGIIAFVATCLSSLGIALNKQFGDARGSASLSKVTQFGEEDRQLL